MTAVTEKSPNWCPHCHEDTLKQWGNSTPHCPAYLTPGVFPRSYRVMGCLNPECRRAWMNLGQPGIWWVTRHSESRSEWLEK